MDRATAGESRTIPEESASAAEILVGGQTLAQRLAESGPFAPIDALHVARQIADALAKAHERQLVHGALSPASIVVSDEVPPLATVTDLESAARDGSAGLIRYAAPEHLNGGTVDARADVFALGLILFEMLEGKPLLPAEDAAVRELLLQGTNPLLPRFSRIAPTGFPALIARAIRRKPTERHRSMADFRAAIDACLVRMGHTRPATPRTPVDPTVRKRTVRVVADEALEEAMNEEMGADENGTPEPVIARFAGRMAAPAPKRVAVQQQPVAVERRGGVARLLARLAGRRVLIGGAVIAASATLVLAAGWPLMRSTSEPVPAVVAMAEPVAAPVPAVETIPVEAPAAPALEAVPGPAPEPLAEVHEQVAALPPVQIPVDEDPPMAAEAPAPERQLPPRIVSRSPAGRAELRVIEGDSVDFGVQASDRNRDERLTTTWFLDGRQTSKGTRWRFAAQYGLAGTTHVVEAEVSDRSGLKAPRAQWKVGVLPRMTEANVRDWLDRLAQAYQRKDVATLRLFGVVTSESDAQAARARFPLFGTYRVTLANQVIRTDGPYASVTFERHELDRGGVVVASIRESYRLEKQATGFVKVR